MAPESVEHKEELEQASLQNEEVKLEAEYQKSLAVLRDNISYKLSSRELKEGRLFDALFNTAEQRNQLEGVYGVQEILIWWEYEEEQRSNKSDERYYPV